MVVKNIAYGATAQPVIQEVKIGNTELTAGTDYAVESWTEGAETYYIYYTDAACANPVKNGDVYLKFNQLPVSTNPYYIKIISAPAAVQGQNPPHSNSTSGLFYVTKKRITLNVTRGDMPAQYYTGLTYTEIDVPAGTTYVVDDQTPLVGGDVIQDVVNGTLKMSYAATSANVKSDGTGNVGSRTAAPITYSGLTADNYEFYYAPDQIDIRQVKIVDGNGKLKPAISITSTGNTVGYNAAEQKPVFTVTFNGKALTADEFAANFDAVSENGSTNASTTPYAFKVKAKSVSNFEGEYGGLDDENDLDTYKLTINKAGLRISVNNKTLVYDGATLNFDNPDAKFVDANVTDNWTVAGLQGNDQLSEVATITGAFETGAEPTVGDKAYKLTATAVTSNGNKYDNYVINLVNGKLTITKRPITVYVTAASKKYLTDDAPGTDHTAYPTTFTTLKGAISAKGYNGFSVYYGDENAQTVGGKNAFVNVTDAQLFYGECKTGTGASATEKASVGYYVVRTNASVNSKGEYPEVLDIKAYNTTNETNFKKNYDITIVKGKYTITGGTVFVSAEAKTKVYGDEDPELTYIVEGIDPNDNNGKLVTAPTLVRAGKGTVEGEKASATGYDINISGAVAPEGYDEIIYTSNKLYITKAPLTVTLPIQKLAKTVTSSTAVDALNKEDIDIQGLKKGENPTSTYTLSVNIDNAQYGTDVTVANGYKLTLKEDFAKNYEIAQGTAPETYKAFITGKVIIGTGTLANLQFTSVDADKATIEDHAEENATVKINFAPRNARTLGVERAWKAGEWTTMVLPFDISVADLSKTLGYAIVNVIDPTKTVVDGTSSKFYGKLTMKGGNGSDEVLVANKPFLIKLADDVKITDENDDPYYYEFTGRKIVASDDLSVDAGKGAKFVGTYTTKTVTKDDNAAIWFMLGYRQPSEDSWVYIKGNSEATWDIVPFEGYIDMTAIPAAARNLIFYVEDIDGTVTAINGIKADGAAKVADGWYNLNGVKLQGVPTEKGIYINNGKKVVIK